MCCATRPHVIGMCLRGGREGGQLHDAEVKAVLIKQDGISEPFKPHG